MDNWGSDNFCDFCTVVAGSGLGGVRCKANLVVHDDVDYALRSVIFQILELGCFVNDSLSGYRGVTMD